jgi:membrane dipeptidase
MFHISYIFPLFLILTFAKNLNDGEPEKYVRDFHDKILTVDTHCDTPMAILNQGLDLGKRNDPPQSQVDFIRMKEGGLDAIFFAAFTPQLERTEENTEAAYQKAHKMIDVTYDACRQNSELAEIATSSDDAKRIEESGKRAIYIGMENGFPLGTDLSRIKEFYDLGVRYITLSHSANNEICDSSTDRNGPEHNGLSKFGKKVVKEMNRLGIMIDVSHISDKSFFDVIKISKTPVIASHSSVRALAHQPRNMSDEMIKALAKNGGVIQICLLDIYVKDPDTTTIRYKTLKDLRDKYNRQSNLMNETEKKELLRLIRETSEKYPKDPVTISDFVDHIDYVKNLVGIDYVGIGSDFDGGGGLTDCEDVSRFPAITGEMLKRGYSGEEIAKVWGANFFRVFREVENASGQ